MPFTSCSITLLLTIGFASKILSSLPLVIKIGAPKPETFDFTSFWKPVTTATVNKLTTIASEILMTDIFTIGRETLLPLTSLLRIRFDMKYSKDNAIQFLTLKYTKVLAQRNVLLFLAIFSVTLFNHSIYASNLSIQNTENKNDFTGPIVGAQRFSIYLDSLKGKRIAVVSNQTSLLKGTHLVDSLLSLGVKITKVFSPEHGFRGNADAGELVDHSKDSKTGLPIVSLYGTNKKPTNEQMQNIDLVVFDIQDVGVRFYTYLSTLHYVYFEEKNGLEWFRRTESWADVLMNADSLNHVYQSSVNAELREELNQMFAEDQAIRERFYRGYNFLARPFIGRKWRKLNEKHIERIIDITREYGFPGEQLIGIDIPAHHPNINATQFSSGIPIVLSVHHYSKANQSYDQLLFDQLKLGYLYNEHFATICDFEGEFGRKKHEKFGFYGLRFGQRGRKENMYDAKRAEIGLMTYLEYKKLNQSTVYTKFWNRLK